MLPARLIPIAVFVIVAACSSSKEKCIPVPTMIPIAYRPAIMVGVADSITGKPIADSASGILRSFSARDSLRHGWAQVDSILIGDLGPGTFTVMVARPGYIPWYKYNVVVAAGNCGAAVTTELAARLTPLR